MSKYLIYILFTFIFAGCVKPKEFPDTPNLEYQSYFFSEDGKQMVFNLNFQDGDGDIGLNTADTFAPYVGIYRYNLYFDLYSKNADGTYHAVKSLTPPFSSVIYKYRLKPIGAVNAGGALYGSISWVLEDYPMVQQACKGDTIRFEIYIFDRALHKSNVIHTPDLYIP